MSGSYDVIIVGGRVAGSTLAALLGRAGFSVLLLERVTFPADTLSTHVIYGDSFGVWERIGAWEKIEELGVAKLAGIAWIRDGLPDINGRFWPVRGHDYSLCIRRLLLDDVLFTNAAETPGVTAISGARVTELLMDDARVTGVKYEVHDGSGVSREISATARLVAGCDGRRSIVAKTVQAIEYMVMPPINFAFYTYVQDAAPGPDPEPMFEIWESEHAAGTPMLAPCDNGITMAIIYLPQVGFDAFRTSKEANFWLKMDSDPRVGPRLRAGTQLMPVRGAGDFVNYVREPVGDGWALVGDAGQFKDPVFGQGIGDAVRSAEYLADCLVEAESSGLEWRRALANYRTKRDLDLISNFQWMIEGRPPELTREEFQTVMDQLGTDPQRAEEFVNVFSHAVSGSEFFGRLHAADLLHQDPASFDTRRARVSDGAGS